MCWTARYLPRRSVELLCRTPHSEVVLVWLPLYHSRGKAMLTAPYRTILRSAVPLLVRIRAAGSHAAGKP